MKFELLLKNIKELVFDQSLTKYPQKQNLINKFHSLNKKNLR